MSVARLRWNERRLARHAESQDQLEMARRAAFRDELRERGVWVP